MFQPSTKNLNAFILYARPERMEVFSGRGDRFNFCCSCNVMIMMRKFLKTQMKNIFFSLLFYHMGFNGYFIMT